MSRKDFEIWLKDWAHRGAPCYTFPDGTTIYFNKQSLPKLFQWYKKYEVQPAPERTQEIEGLWSEKDRVLVEAREYEVNKMLTSPPIREEK